MRAALLIAAALLSFTQARAQDALSLDRSIELRAEQDMQRQRLIALQNELHAQEGQLRTEQTLRDLQAQREPLRVRPAPLDPSSARLRREPDATGLASIPDAALAASNARVRAASHPAP